MRARPSWAPEDIDITKPSVARVYDFALGGSHNFAADREFAAQVFAALPEVPQMARDNRAFLRRAVRYLCSVGVDQFLDLGSGIPTVGGVHEIAHETDPHARIVYVDHDPVAVTHSRELLAGDDRLAVVRADLRQARSVLDDPHVSEHLDLTRPVAVLLLSVLHFVHDDEDPATIVGEYMRGASAGSHLVISHATSDNPDATALEEVYRRPGSPQPGHARSHADIGALFGGHTMVDPGLVRMPLWRPDSPEDIGPGAGAHLYYAGVGRSA